MRSVEYDVLKIFKVLRKKLWVVLIFAVLFGIIAIPVSNASYNAAVSDYNRLIAEQNVSEGVLDQRENNHLGTFSCFYVLTHPENIPLEVYMNNVVKFMDSDSLIRSVWNSLSSYPDIKSFGHTIDNITVEYLPNSSVLLFTFSNTSKTVGQAFSERWIDEGLSIVYNLLSYPDTYENKFETFFADPERSTIRDLSVSQLTEFIQPPERSASYFRIVGTAVVFGILLSCFVILLADFIQTGRRNEKESL